MDFIIDAVKAFADSKHRRDMAQDIHTKLDRMRSVVDDDSELAPGMDPLVEMHLVLREAGWEPEHEDDRSVEGGIYHWTRAGCDREITTSREGEPAIGFEFALGKAGEFGEGDDPNSTSVEELRQRLKELAR